MKKQMIKRKDGSYSQRGLWDNIRANKGSGKKPTAEMLKQERKIKANMANGGINNPGFKALPMSVQQNIKANMAMGGYANNMVASVPPMPNRLMQNGGLAPQTSAGMSVLQEAMLNTQKGNPMMPVSGNGMMQMKKGGMNSYGAGGKMPTDIARARFMAAANGNSGAAKSKASQYGYKLQGGGNIIEETSTASNPERMGTIDIRTQRPGFFKRMMNKATGKHKTMAEKTETKRKVDDMKARIADSKKVQELPMSEQFTSKNIARATQATGDKLRLFGTNSPLVTSGLFEADPNSFIDNYLNPAKFIGDMATNLGQGISETMETGSIAPTVKGLVTPIVAGATAGLMKGPMHKLTHGVDNVVGTGVSKLSKNVGKVTKNAVSKATHTGGHALEHEAQHLTVSPFSTTAHKNGGTIKDMYMMKKGGQFPDRYKKMGFKGVDQPIKTTNGNKSHAVVTKVDGNYKLIRFGQKGEVGSPDGTPRNKAFKARHAKNIAKGKSSAAYWANKVKW